MDAKDNKQFKRLCHTINAAILESEEIKNQVKKLTREEMFSLANNLLCFDVWDLISCVKEYDEYVKDIDVDGDMIQNNITEDEFSGLENKNTKELFRVITVSIITSKDVYSVISEANDKDIEIMAGYDIYIVMEKLLVKLCRSFLEELQKPALHLLPQEIENDPFKDLNEEDKRWLKKLFAPKIILRPRR